LRPWTRRRGYQGVATPSCGRFSMDACCTECVQSPLPASSNPAVQHGPISRRVARRGCTKSSMTASA